MDFTQYSQLLSYPQVSTGQTVIDILGQPLESRADAVIDIEQAEKSSIEAQAPYDVMLLRFALSCVDDPFAYLSNAVSHVKAGGYIILQDYLMPDSQQVADYINGFIHIFDKKHRKSFAQYEWNGLLLDVGLRIDECSRRQVHSNIHEWIEQYQSDALGTQHAQIMLVQAPDRVMDTMQIKYPGTPYAEFVLQELVCVAQKGS